MAGVTKHFSPSALESRALTYTDLGATAVSEEVWADDQPDFRRYEKSTVISAPWEDARSLMLRWGVKTQSGFAVSGPDSSLAVVQGASYSIRFGPGPLAVTEPVRVIAVVDEPLRCGFAYGTLDGHPVSGEEAFVLGRAAEGGPVYLTIRSLTRAAPKGLWRCAFPTLLAAQWMFRRRYLRSLSRAVVNRFDAP